MWATRTPAARGPARLAPVGEGLYLYLRCHEHVLALDTRHIARLLLPEEALVMAPGAPAVYRIDGQARAVWNLGEVFKGPPAYGSLVLLDARVLGGRVAAADAPSVAFAAGACLKVAAAPPLTPLPPGIFRGKRGHVRGAFAAQRIAGGGLPGASIGLVLDPEALFGAEEIAASVAAIARMREPPR